LGRGEEAVRALEAAAHAGTCFQQLAIGGQTHAPVWRVTRKRGGGGNDPISHQAQVQAVLAQGQPGQVGVFESHPKGGFGWQVVGVKPQEATVAQAPFLGVKLGDESGPLPVAPSNEQPAQANAHGIEGRWSKVAAETLAQYRSPRREVDETQHQIEVIQTDQIVGRLNVVGWNPLVVGATDTGSPVADARRKLQADG